MSNLISSLGLACLLLSTVAQAADVVDSEAFYDSRANQVFKNVPPQQFSIGYEEGDDVPFLTWNGTVAGKDLYLELHGNAVEIIAGKQRISRRLQKAFRLTGESALGFNFRGVDLYIQSDTKAMPAALCIESLEPDVSRPAPYRSAYVIVAPFSAARMYKIPRRFASCKGLVRSESGNDLLAPKWQVDDGVAQTPSLRYYRLGSKGMVADGKVIDHWSADSVQ